MANNKSIQFLRKTSGAVTDDDIKSLLPGQPLVDFPNRKLIIGTPTSASNPSSAIEFTSKLYMHVITIKTMSSTFIVEVLSTIPNSEPFEDKTALKGKRLQANGFYISDTVQRTILSVYIKNVDTVSITYFTDLLIQKSTDDHISDVSDDVYEI